MKQDVISLKASSHLTFFLIISYSIAMMVAWLLPLTLILHIALMGACLLSMAQTLWQYAWLRDSRSLITIRIRSESSWVVWDKSGEMHLATLLKHSTVTKNFIILNFKILDESHFRTAIVLSDSLSSDALRHLKQGLFLLKGKLHTHSL